LSVYEPVAVGANDHQIGKTRHPLTVGKRSKVVTFENRGAERSIASLGLKSAQLTAEAAVSAQMIGALLGGYPRVALTMAVPAIEQTAFHDVRLIVNSVDLLFGDGLDVLDRASQFSRGGGESPPHFPVAPAARL